MILVSLSCNKTFISCDLLFNLGNKFFNLKNKNTSKRLGAGIQTSRQE
jgi:hypothetical protein